MCAGCGRKYQRPTRTADQLAQQQTSRETARRAAQQHRPISSVRKAVAPVSGSISQIQTPLLKPPV